MTPSRHSRLYAGVFILLGTTGCDNVAWGGVDWQIVPPPPKLAQNVETDNQAFAEYGLPRGPLVFHVRDVEGGSQLVPIAELAGGAMRPLRRPAGVSAAAYEERFRETVLPVGSQFDVFRRGARVGTFVAQEVGPVTQCGIPTVTGNTTVVAAAVGFDDYLAFRQGLSPASRGEFTPPQVTGPIRTYAAIVAERLILQEGLPRPRSWPGAQRDLQPVEILPGGQPEMTATYLVGDSLAQGPSAPEGYSVFYIADYETRRGYATVYSEVRDYRVTGKAAPRLVDYVDWNDDEIPELVLQVFGQDRTWYEVISQRNGEWEKVYDPDPCQ